MFKRDSTANLRNFIFRSNFQVHCTGSFTVPQSVLLYNYLHLNAVQHERASLKRTNYAHL